MITNTGNRAGAEAVQLYTGAIGGKVSRPVKELKGFEKVLLQPDESKTIHFIINKKSLAYYEPKLDDWFAASGRYGIYVGASSRDIRLQTEITYVAETVIPVVYTHDSSLGEFAGNPKAAMLFSAVSPDNTAEAGSSDLGEGGAELAAAMMEEMPLGSLVSFGVMNEEQLDGLIALLNS